MFTFWKSPYCVSGRHLKSVTHILVMLIENIQKEFCRQLSGLPWLEGHPMLQRITWEQKGVPWKQPHIRGTSMKRNIKVYKDGEMTWQQQLGLRWNVYAGKMRSPTSCSSTSSSSIKSSSVSYLASSSLAEMLQYRRWIDATSIFPRPIPIVIPSVS